MDMVGTHTSVAPFAVIAHKVLGYVDHVFEKRLTLESLIVECGKSEDKASAFERWTP
jgi:hypothetical protein